MKRFALLSFAVFAQLMILSGCGDTFRPIIIPNPPTFPNPAAAHTVVTISDNAPPQGQPEVVAGSAMVIDVSGDAVVSTANVGLAPVHAVQQTANQVLVLNHSAPGQHSESVTKLLFSGTTINSTQTIALPADSAPNFIAVAPADTNAYVSLPGSSSIGVVNLSANLLASTYSVGNNPVAIAVTPDKSKVYVANQGDSTISAFNVVVAGLNTVNLSQRTGSPIHTSSAPSWLAARTDNQRVYVLESNGTLAWLDTTATAGPDPLTETAISVPFAKTMIYDINKNRLYIPGGQEVAIVDVSQSAPALITGAPIAIPTVSTSSRSATDPCSATTAQTLTVAGAAALPDSTRAYIGSYYEDSQANICPQVTVIDVASSTIKSSIAVPGFPAFDAFCSTTRFRITMAAGGDSTRAYLGSCDGGNVSMIDTSNDTYIESQQAPVGTRQTIPPGPINLPQNPVFMIAGP